MLFVSLFHRTFLVLALEVSAVLAVLASQMPCVCSFMLRLFGDHTFYSFPVDLNLQIRIVV